MYIFYGPNTKYVSVNLTDNCVIGGTVHIFVENKSLSQYIKLADYQYNFLHFSTLINYLIQYSSMHILLTNQWVKLEQ